jgi:Rrf2 family transcriptional regulator, iron-sulfur cluster assembly transcription factor
MSRASVSVHPQIIRFFRSKNLSNTNLREWLKFLKFKLSGPPLGPKGEHTMRMSTRSRFAVTAMIDIALNGQISPVSLTDIGTRHQISVSYLEQLFSKLRQGGLVQSTRGPSGGYSLARSDKAISVADIVGAIETAPGKPGRGEKTFPEKEGASEWMTQALWDSLNARMIEHMQAISLRQLADEQRAQGVRIEARPVKRGVYAPRKHKPVHTTAPNSVFALGRSLMAGH